MKQILTLIMLFSFLFVYGVEKDKNVLSIDFGWCTEGFTNEGFGFGLTYERVLWDFLSFKLRHGVVETYKNAVGNRVDSYVFSFLLCWNIFNRCLDGPSLGLGYGYDLVIVTKPESGESKYSFLLTFLDTIASYKFVLAERFFIEPYVEFMWALGDVKRSKTGIAMDTTYVNIIGLNAGITF